MTGLTTWNELLSQPDTWQRLIERLDRGPGVPAVSLEDYDEVIALGSGTSYYLALAAADHIRRRCSIDARAVPSCEVMLDAWETRPAPQRRRRRLALAISRSGESSELLAAIKALQAAGVFVLGISCVAESALLARADEAFLIDEGREDGLVMLRSFTSMLIALQHLFGTEDDRAALRALPDAGRQALTHNEEVRALVKRRAFNRFVFLGSGSSYPLALEASLKGQEMSISTSEAYHSLEYRHGPKATADCDTIVTIFTLSDAELGKSLARDVKALGATVLVVGAGAELYAGIADLVIPAAHDADPGRVAPVDLLPLQVLAFETAMRRGKNPDAPVNLSKVVIL